MIKIITNYLPQFHRIPENDEWWGEGFTDWEAVKHANKFYDWQYQPKIPQNNNYYDLTDVDTIKWQAKLARDHGVYGFGIYHYWFSSEKMLLQKPAELLWENKDIDINYLFIWDNTSWIRTWKKMRFSNAYAPSFDTQSPHEFESGVLAKIDYGNEEDWKKHFKYLSGFFRDRRYIKINNRPVFVIFKVLNDANTLRKMTSYWDKLAKNEGYDGIFIIGNVNVKRESISEYEVLYEPAHSVYQGNKNIFEKVLLKTRKAINKKRNQPNLYEYVSSWEKVLKTAEKMRERNVFYSGFVSYDDTARRDRNATIVKGDSPEMFEKYFTRLLELSKEHGKEYVFLTAWNEWSEGAYLEPDERYGMRYLEAVNRAVESVNRG